MADRIDPSLDQAPAPWQFSIAQLLVATALVAGAMLVFRVVPWPWGWPALAGVLVLWVIACLWGTGSPSVRGWIFLGFAPLLVHGAMCLLVVSDFSSLVSYSRPLFAWAWLGVTISLIGGGLAALVGDEQRLGILSVGLGVSVNAVPLLILAHYWI